MAQGEPNGTVEPVRVLIAPDSFTGSMTAPQAADAIASGWLGTSPHDVAVLAPLSDGGPGFIDALAAAQHGERLSIDTTDPWGRPARGELLVVREDDFSTAYIEVAQAAGSTSGRRGDPGAASSLGVSPLLRAAVGAGAARIVVGLGGTLVTDGGAGMLAGLGARARSRDGGDATALLAAGGAGLGAVAKVDLDAARGLLAGADLVMASDVDSPLLGPRGAARGFAPQKGATPEQVEDLESSLRTLAHACGRLPDGRSPAAALGSGAAGGLGFALLHLGARRVSGIEFVLDAIRFADRVAECDLVITGEGSFDWQSLHGKVIAGVCTAAMHHGRPVLVLAGRVEVGRREWMAVGVSGAFSIIDPQAAAVPEQAQAMASGPELLSALAARAARTWSR